MYRAAAVCTLVAFMLALFPRALAEEAPPAAAPKDERLEQAKQHFEVGKSAYNAGDFQTAIREFKAAEALRPSPILAYNIGLANERLGRLNVAVKYYRRYLEGQPSAPNRDEVEAHIAELEKQIAAQPVPPATPAPPGTPPGPPTAAQPSDMPPPEPGYAKPGQPGYSSYDPYSASAPPPAPPPPKRRRSLWWLPLVIVGGALITAGVVIAIYYGTTTTTYERSPTPTQSPALGFHF